MAALFDPGDLVAIRAQWEQDYGGTYPDAFVRRFVDFVNALDKALYRVTVRARVQVFAWARDEAHARALAEPALRAALEADGTYEYIDRDIRQATVTRLFAGMDPPFRTGAVDPSHYDWPYGPRIDEHGNPLTD